MESAEPEWNVEATPDDPAFTHLVGFSDWVAHERDDLVAQAAAFLRRIDGVEQTIHEDREVILISAPGIDADAIADEFRPWWQDIRHSDPPWEDLLKSISTAARAVLKPLGFRKRKHAFNRQTADDVWHVIELRRLDGDEGRIDIGIYVEGINELLGRNPRYSSWINEVECQFRDPLGGRHTFNLTGDPGDVVALLEEEIAPRLEHLRSREQLRAAAGDGTRKLGMHRPANVFIAALAAMDGDRDVAQAVMQQTFEEANRRARPGVHSMAQRMGLDPLVTGVDRTLSIEDEAVLEAWRDGHQARLDELQSLIDAYPVSRQRLGLVGTSKRVDLASGDSAIGNLWRWLVQRTPEVDAMITEPEQLAARYVGHTFDQLSPAQKRLAELLASFMFEAVRQRAPGVVWDLDESGEIAVVGSRSESILSRGQQQVAWLAAPPATVRDPERANMLSRRIDWLIERVS